MSAQAKKIEAPRPLTKDDMKNLVARHRPRFTDEQVLAALQYQRDHNCTLAVAAATQGMTNQTLAARRNAIAKKMGIEPAAEPAKPAVTKKK